MALDFWLQKLILVTENDLFLTALTQVVLQGIKKYFEFVLLGINIIEFHLKRYEIP